MFVLFDDDEVVVDVETGVFGAYMKVDLLNDGPVTILLEKEFDED